MRVLWVLARYAANRLVGRHILELEKAASKAMVLVEAETVAAVPAITLPGAFDTVATADELSTVAMQREFLAATHHVQNPTIAYVLSEACVLGNWIWTSRHRIGLTHLATRRWQWPIAVDHALLGTVDLPFFGHWLTEDCPLALLGERLDVPVLVPGATSSAHKREYARLLCLKTMEAQNAVVSELIIVRDYNAQNALKRQHLAEMRARLAKGRTKGRFDRLYLTRGGAWSSRNADNEEAIQAALQAAGFMVIDPTELSIDRLLGLAWGAEVVVGVEGSQLSHAIFFLRDGGKLCSLQPPTRFTAILKHWCDSVGIVFGFAVGEQTDTGWAIDPARVLHTIALLEKAQWSAAAGDAAAKERDRPA